MKTVDRIKTASVQSPAHLAARTGRVPTDADERLFNSLTSLWGQYFALVEGIEARYPALLVALITPLTALCTYQYATSDSVGSRTVTAPMLLVAVILINLMIFSFLADQFRYAAVPRGDLIRIEARLNRMLGCNAYIWNSVQLNAPKTRGKANALLFFTFAITLVGLVVVCGVFIETVSPHWMRGFVLAGPMLDGAVYWLAENAGGVLWFAVLAFLADAVCIVVAFARNNKAQEAAFERSWDLSSYPELVSEVNSTLYNKSSPQLEPPNLTPTASRR